MNQYLAEVSHKLTIVRQMLEENELQGLRLRGTDWFAWITAGASNSVLLTAETGIAEVLVTPQDAWVLTDEIEAQRLIDEELPANFKLFVYPWAAVASRESFVRDATHGGKICSERPIFPLESQLPRSLYYHKLRFLSSELERYRQVCRKASEAMTEVLQAAQPTWTEYQLAGAGAEALWKRGLHPALTLVAGERRLPLYRHATPTEEAIGREAMLVFCARGFGLYANLTRFVSFDSLGTKDEQVARHRQVAEIEAQALNLCQSETSLNTIYHALALAYEQQGFPNAIREHHQGGITGYLAREIVATPTTTEILQPNMAVAWNPSLPGAKIEDTFVLLEDGNLENLTFDANFPSVEINGRLRPIPLIR
ncbi:peptidase M24 [Aphanothece hegewaldii CCALA 016]|uniref:Peptidase M24 n=1 Tax=Aphanothece hegewaldii CCALA 016 TaxID=2107694 RepID=A0A2T1LXZ8_9CHRO|nr:M24 family metallopeptidase [Aphanothece hegewaldii]PSF37262.1 peptidase M24 [Aphanothece hegewaldii CCALA 016]